MIRLAIGAFGAAVSLILFPSSAGAASAAVGPAVFGSAVLSTNTTRYDERWNSAKSPALGAGSDIAAKARQLQGSERLRFVNLTVNKAIVYRDDSSNWSASDYWASAAQTFSRGAGDCEDYAIAKMQVLRASGVAANDLFLVIGNDLTASGAHAMLIVRSGGRYWVLDNFHNEVRLHSEYSEFRPIISLSSTGRWLHGYKAGALKSRANTRMTGQSPSIQPSGTFVAVIATQTVR